MDDGASFWIRESLSTVVLRPSHAFTALAADYTTGPVLGGLANEWASIQLTIVAPTVVSIAEIR